MGWTCYTVGDVTLDLHDSVYDKQYMRYPLEKISEHTIWCRIEDNDLDLHIKFISDIEITDGNYKFQISDRKIKEYIYQNYILGSSIEYVARRDMNLWCNPNFMYLKTKTENEISFTKNLDEAMILNYDYIHWDDIERELNGFGLYLKRKSEMKE